MKLAIVGSRSFDDYDLLEDTLNSYSKIDLIISGGAKGADHLAEKYAKSKNIELKVFKPNWSKHKRGAGQERNKLIVEACDELLAFWDGQSKGTNFTIGYAEKINKCVNIVDFAR